MRIFLTFVTVLLVTSCAAIKHDKQPLSEVAKDYFNVYDSRQDFDLLMSFYHEDAQLFDIVYGNELNNKTEIRDFFAWGKGTFQSLEGSGILTVNKQLVQKNVVVTEGYFHQFEYNGQRLGPWLFIIVQEFNQQNKIIKQTDWINYTPRKDFLGGANINQQLINY